MATATEVDVEMNWQPVTSLYALSEPFNNSDHIAVTVSPVGTEVFPATEAGVAVGDPAFGLIAHRKWFPPISHEQALAEMGYEL